MILWSGGADSTLILMEELKEHGHAKALAIRHEACGSEAQKECEATARERLLEEVASRGWNVEFNEVRVESTAGGVVRAEGLPQAAVWLSHAVTYGWEDEFLDVGYIRGDDLWHVKADFLDAFWALRRIHEWKADIRFPLEWWHKHDVLNRLREFGVLEMVSFCEAPRKNGVRCGRCVKCKLFKEAQ